MRLGIFTFHGSDNYGSVLQAYALSRYLNKQGHNAEIVNYYFEYDYRQYKIFRTYRYKSNPISLASDILSLKHNILRKNNFEIFRKSYLPISENKYYDTISLSETLDIYDAFICGSDQIWNTRCTNGVNDAYFLKFSKNNSIKIAYAPSLGTDAFEELELKKIAAEIASFKSISLRETSSAQMIQPYIDNPIEIVLDPTMILDVKDYNRLLLNTNKPIQQSYIFMYILGSSRAYKNIINYGILLARQKNCKLIYIIENHNLLKFIYGHNVSGCSPNDFLSFIKDAKYVITNSFHATVFSVLFKKQFVSFSRGNSTSRIYDLLNNLGLSNRMNDICLDIDEAINYEIVHQKIEEKKIISKKFLEDSLK